MITGVAAGMSASKNVRAWKASTNVQALEQTLSELDAKGRLSSIDAAHVQMLRTMAGALDDERSNAALWRQYREALGELMADDAGDDDDAAGLFSEVGDTAQA